MLTHDLHTQGNSTRSRMLKEALKYTKRGIPVFPCKPDKSPYTDHGFKDATTDPRKIHMWWNRWPGALIGIPTGEQSGIISLDLDVYKPGAMTVEDIETELGPISETTTVRTGRDGLQLLYRNPFGERLKGIPEDQLGKGVCVKASGGYIIVPPSHTAGRYEWLNRLPLAEVPEWLLEKIRGRSTEAPRPSRPRDRVEIPDGEPIPEGSRNSKLFFEALSLKDQGKTREEVLDELLEINEARCSPPLDASEVEKIAKQAIRYPIRSGSPSPELVEAVRQMILAWWKHNWRGLGGQSDRDLVRGLLELGSRYGRLNADGSVDIDAAVRTLSLITSISYVTISRGCTKRLEEAGWITKIPSDDPRKGATWRIRVPSRVVNTSSKKTLDAGLLTTRDALPEETPTWRHRGLVGKGAGGVEALLEVYGPMSRDEVAEALGWTNVREVERRYLRKLEDRGLAEKWDDGRYALVEDHAETVEEVKAMPYAVLLRRERWEWDPNTQTRVYTPAEYGREASEDQRTEADREKHEKNREDWRAALILRERVRDDAGDVAFEELPPTTTEMLAATTTEMLAANRVGRYLLQRGWKRFDKRLWVNPETAEIISVDRAMEEVA